MLETIGRRHRATQEFSKYPERGEIRIRFSKLSFSTREIGRGGGGGLAGGDS